VKSASSVVHNGGNQVNEDCGFSLERGDGPCWQRTQLAGSQESLDKISCLLI
jgi:hypothetical protein